MRERTDVAKGRERKKKRMQGRQVQRERENEKERERERERDRDTDRRLAKTAGEQTYRFAVLPLGQTLVRDVGVD